MPTYIYTTVPKGRKAPIQFEVIQSMKDDPLTHHPETGEPIRRIVTGGLGFNMNGDKVDPFSQKQFRERTGQRGDTLGALWDRSAELSQMRAEKTGNGDPVKETFYRNYKRSRRGTPHMKQLAEQQIAATAAANEKMKKAGISISLT